MHRSPFYIKVVIFKSCHSQNDSFYRWLEIWTKSVLVIHFFFRKTITVNIDMPTAQANMTTNGNQLSFMDWPAWMFLANSKSWIFGKYFANAKFGYFSMIISINVPKPNKKNIGNMMTDASTADFDSNPMSVPKAIYKSTETIIAIAMENK